MLPYREQYLIVSWTHCRRSVGVYLNIPLTVNVLAMDDVAVPAIAICCCTSVRFAPDSS